MIKKFKDKHKDTFLLLNTEGCKEKQAILSIDDCSILLTEKNLEKLRVALFEITCDPDIMDKPLKKLKKKVAKIKKEEAIKNLPEEVIPEFITGEQLNTIINVIDGSSDNYITDLFHPTDSDGEEPEFIMEESQRTLLSKFDGWKVFTTDDGSQVDHDGQYFDNFLYLVSPAGRLFEFEDRHCLANGFEFENKNYPMVETTKYIQGSFKPKTWTGKLK